MKQPSALFIIVFLSMFSLTRLPLSAQEQRDTFGGWEHLDIAHSFKDSNWFASLNFEHENIQYRKLDAFISSATMGYRIADWLKCGAVYDFLIESGGRAHRTAAFFTGTVKGGNLTVSIRERYQHIWRIYSSTQANELKSKLTVQYDIPRTGFKPYLAVEVYTWDKWLKTRHYAGTIITLNETFSLEAYYLYYTFATKPAQHIIGLGLNITL